MLMDWHFQTIDASSPQIQRSEVDRSEVSGNGVFYKPKGES